jgi:DNA-binding MarR family transcriptional regulator
MEQSAAGQRGRDGASTAARDALVGRVVAAELGLRRQLLATRMSPMLDLNLTMQQTKLLLTLSFQGCSGADDTGLSGQDLARHLGVGLATISGIVDRLVGQGLVSRTEDHQDRRVRRVELTAAGRDLVARLRDAGVEHLRGLLNRLDDETLTDLERVLARLAEAARSAAAEQPPAAGSP